MKTVESARLYFKNEKSDKVYEVDLCQVEDGLFIVNFRYGKRNSNLREGTKTVFPVSSDEAKRAFDQLVLSKTTKGYLHVGQAAEDIAIVEETSNESEDSASVRKAILRNLKDLKTGNYTKDWIASRVIWKAGELKIEEAEQYLNPYLVSADFQEQYAAVWALGRLKSKASVNELFALYNSTTSATIKTLCIAALLGFENPCRAEVKQSIENTLPSLLREAINAKNRKSIKSGIKDFTNNASNKTAAIWTNLYLLSVDNYELRALLKEELQRISTKKNEFKAVRKIYKLAEFSDDFEFLAICAKKTAINPANYNSNSWAVVLDNEYVRIQKEKSKLDSRLAFSSATKAYFNKRTLRRLKKTLNFSTSEYIELATEILLSVNDQIDKQKEFSTYTYDFENDWELIEQWHPKYHLYAAYNFILYNNSDRFKVNPKNKSYSYLAATAPDKKPVSKREEHNSALWDNAPEAICKILAHAKVAEVNDFALKVFKANPHFKNAITENHLAQMASSIYESTVNLTVELIKDIYAGNTLPFKLIIGLLGSKYELATNLGKESLLAYIEQGKLKTENIIEIILFGNSQLLQVFENVQFAFDSEEKIQYSQIAPLVFNADKYNEDYIRALIKFAELNHLKALFSEFTSADIEQFVSAKENCLKELGLLLMRLNAKPTHELAAPMLDTFLNNDDPLLRAAAVELLADFPDDFLLQKTELVKKFVFAEHKELRESIVAVVQKLIPLNNEFKESLFNALLIKICEQEEIEGSYNDHLALLQSSFSNELDSLQSEMIIELLLSSVDAAQKLGEEQFHKQGLKNEFKLNNWTTLMDSDVFSIRSEIQRFYARHVSTILADLDESLKVLESKWTDLRNWAMTFFLENSRNNNWTLEQILMVADSPKEDIQSFARSLISKLFSSTHGKELMVHLSEHPSRSMMLFNSNYLNIYAKDNPDVIVQLKQYFKNILYGINLGAASKARVYAFLMQELKKDEKVAQMTLAILSEILATSAIGDKSNCIDLTLAIGELYPYLELPISVSPINKYSNAV